MKKKIYMATAVLAAVLLSGVAPRRAMCKGYAWPLATSSPEDTVTQLFSEKFCRRGGSAK